MKKKSDQYSVNLSEKNSVNNSIDQNWEQDNQSWWDWYLTLAENSNKKYKSIKLNPLLVKDIVIPSFNNIKKELSTPYDLKESHIDLFNKNGFIKLTNVLSIGAVSMLRKEILFLLNKEFNLNKSNRFLSMEMMWTENKIIREYVFSSRISKIAANLLKVKRLRLYHDNILTKESGCGRTPWHCDDDHFPLDTQDVITVWIPAQFTPREMGPLSFAKPLNVYDMVSKIKFNKFNTSYDKQVNKIFKEKNVLIEDGPFEIGEVSFHHNFSFHTAGKNKTNKLRVALANTFFADGARVNNNPTMVSGDWKKFIPGVKPGGIVATKLNPICWPSKK
ncbi:MAG: snoK [Pelagibacterales bacterium]|nr:snoK [Pelagibacterales bacterium]OUU62700.1 MAG: snoK [Alphaproteobacteria bacterium TMED62]|tara:strand:- start:4343 stop:5341 length:999 start_codon:yes stop_codon:yes gene_type:complete